MLRDKSEQVVPKYNTIKSLKNPEQVEGEPPSLERVLPSYTFGTFESHHNISFHRTQRPALPVSLKLLAASKVWCDTDRSAFCKNLLSR